MTQNHVGGEEIKPEEYKVVSRFELAIREAAGLPMEDYRAETSEEKADRLRRQFQEIASQIKIKKS
jgi:hypothetical protein